MAREKKRFKPQAPKRPRKKKTGSRKQTPLQQATRKCRRCKTSYIIGDEHTCPKRQKGLRKSGRNRSQTSSSSAGLIFYPEGEGGPQKSSTRTSASSSSSSSSRRELNPAFIKNEDEESDDDGGLGDGEDDIGMKPSYEPTELPFPPADNNEVFKPKAPQFIKTEPTFEVDNNNKMDTSGPSSSSSSSSSSSDNTAPRSLADFFLSGSQELTFFQLPSHLPINMKAPFKDTDDRIKVKLENKMKRNREEEEQGASKRSKREAKTEDENKDENYDSDFESDSSKVIAQNLQDIPEGLLGKLVVRKSGRVQLVLGDVILDMNEGAPAQFYQHVVSMDPSVDKNVYNLGKLRRKFVASYDIRQIAEER